MSAWLATSESEKSDVTRQEKIKLSGDVVQMPAVSSALFVADCLKALNFCARGAMGPIPIPPSELTTWANGTATELGPIDYQDILDASAVYVGSLNEFDGKAVPAPWSPDLTAEEEEKVANEEEAAWDRAMGLG